MQPLELGLAEKHRGGEAVLKEDSALSSLDLRDFTGRNTMGGLNRMFIRFPDG